MPTEYPTGNENFYSPTTSHDFTNEPMDTGEYDNATRNEQPQQKLMGFGSLSTDYGTLCDSETVAAFSAQLLEQIAKELPVLLRGDFPESQRVSEDILIQVAKMTAHNINRWPPKQAHLFINTFAENLSTQGLAAVQATKTDVNGPLENREIGTERSEDDDFIVVQSFEEGIASKSFESSAVTQSFENLHQKVNGETSAPNDVGGRGDLDERKSIEGFATLSLNQKVVEKKKEPILEENDELSALQEVSLQPQQLEKQEKAGKFTFDSPIRSNNLKPEHELTLVIVENTPSSHDQNLALISLCETQIETVPGNKPQDHSCKSESSLPTTKLDVFRNEAPSHMVERSNRAPMKSFSQQTIDETFDNNDPSFRKFDARVDFPGYKGLLKNTCDSKSVQTSPLASPNPEKDLGFGLNCHDPLNFSSRQQKPIFCSGHSNEAKNTQLPPIARITQNITPSQLRQNALSSPQVDGCLSQERPTFNFAEVDRQRKQKQKMNGHDGLGASDARRSSLYPSLLSKVEALDIRVPKEQPSKNKENTRNCDSMKSYAKVVQTEKQPFETKAQAFFEEQKDTVANNCQSKGLLFAEQPPLPVTEKPKASVTLSKEDKNIESRVAKAMKESEKWLKNNRQLEVRKFESGSTKKSLNILVLGQTGVGKSTWINAFVNYLSFETLDAAMDTEAPICVIPTKFSMFDENYKRHEVLLGDHENEVYSDDCQSVTQNTKTYKFEQEDRVIHIIDTPGINDTQGVKKDDENILNILNAIAPFEEIHAICFLFKANEARLTDTFRYSISKLLSNLSKTALNNACFVFTNARGTFYRPGDTMGPLKECFRELKKKTELSVQINGENTFCLDNEAFRFLCAYFNGIDFPDTQMKTFGDSWRHSSKEVHRLLEHASRIRAHKTAETLSINNARNWIRNLIDPIFKTCTIIQKNLQQFEKQKEDLLQANSFEQLQRLSKIVLTSFEVIPLDAPQLICKSDKCMSCIREVSYGAICHNLKDTENMSTLSIFGNGVCSKCRCPAGDHQWEYYKQNMETTFVESSINFSNKITAAEKKKKLIRNLESIIEEFNDELHYILLAMATFALFFQKNAIQKGNLFDEHLRKMISAEQKKMEMVKGVDRAKYDGLVSLLEDFLNLQIKLNYKRASEEISLEELEVIRSKLFNMSFTGSNVAQIFDIHVKVNNQVYEGEVTKCDKSNYQKICNYVGKKWRSAKDKCKDIIFGS